MKVLVETLGSIMLLNPYGNVTIPFNRPAVTEATPWIMNQVALQHLEVMPYRLIDEATDKEFALWWAECDGDRTLALSSFAVKFGVPAPGVVVEEDPAEATPPRGRRSR